MTASCQISNYDVAACENVVKILLRCWSGVALSIPLDTKHKLNVHKAFSRHPGRFLNVLCTFNLRPVCRAIRVAEHEILFSH